jgi:GxxExxY protein
MNTESLRVIPAAWNEVTREIIAAAIEVHSVLGPGLLERLYEDAFAYELVERGLRLERQRPIRLRYRAIDIGDLRIDLVVESLVVIELKAIERVLDVHRAQLLSYLRSADLPLGLLINFNEARVRDGMARIVNPHAAAMRQLPSLAAPGTPAQIRLRFSEDANGCI